MAGGGSSSTAADGNAEPQQQHRKMNVSAALEILCPPDRHIPVEFHEIYAVIKPSLSVGERARFEEVVQLLESLFACEFQALRRNLKHNFLCFSMGAKDQPMVTRVGSGLPTAADLDQREEKLVSDFCQLMAQARFHILSKAEWALAKADQFMFTLPVAVNWEYYDDQLLRRFWQGNGERRYLRKLLPEMADRCLVFHRGISVAEESGAYYSEKVDLLVDYLVAGPAKRFWRWLSRRKPPLAGPKTLKMTDSKHANCKVVQRLTLRRLMPTWWAVIKNMHKSFKLQEPAFKEVVVLYRAKPQKRQRQKLPALQRPRESRLRDILSGRNVHVKCFHDIPMADLDVIFADKKVYLKPLTIIQLVITIVGGLVGAIMVLLKGNVDMNVLWSSLSLVGARCGQVYTSAQAERSATIQDMVNILYDKTNDAQEGVMSMLLEDMADQQLKEAVLAYSMMYVREAEMSMELVDQECEEFLDKNFELKVDYAVEDAMPKLLEYGLVRQSKTNAKKFEAVHVDEAHRVLEKRWNEAFKTLAVRSSEDFELPLSDLLAGVDKHIRTMPTAPRAPPPPPPPAPAGTQAEGGALPPGAIINSLLAPPPLMVKQDSLVKGSGSVKAGAKGATGGSPAKGGDSDGEGEQVPAKAKKAWFGGVFKSSKKSPADKVKAA